MADEIIKADDVVVSPRGRKSELNPDLVKAFKALKPGEALRLVDTYGCVPKEQRSRVSQEIRKNFHAARAEKPRIDYTPEGVPQVRINPKQG